MFHLGRLLSYLQTLESLSGTNTLAYYEHSYITKEKSFVTLTRHSRTFKKCISENELSSLSLLLLGQMKIAKSAMMHSCNPFLKD